MALKQFVVLTGSWHFHTAFPAHTHKCTRRCINVEIIIDIAGTNQQLALCEGGLLLSNKVKNERQERWDVLRKYKIGTCHGKQTRVEHTKIKHYNAEFAAREREHRRFYWRKRGKKITSNTVRTSEWFRFVLLVFSLRSSAFCPHRVVLVSFLWFWE